MASNDATLRLVEMSVAHVAIGYLLMTLACGALARRHKSWAAWLATAGFGYLAITTSIYVMLGGITWFFPSWDVEWLSNLSGSLSRFGRLALFVAAIGFSVFVFRHERRRGDNSNSPA